MACTAVTVVAEPVDKGQDLTSTVTSVTDCEVDMAPNPNQEIKQTTEAKTPLQRFAFFVFILGTLLTLGDWFGLLG
jgi:hypothetical protein